MRDSDSKHRDLDPLLARLVDETITPDEMLKLERRLDGNPEEQRRYLHYLDLHADLVQVDGGEQGEALVRRLRRRHWIAAGLAAAAAITLASLFLFRDDTPSPMPVVRVVDLNGPVKWIVGGEAISRIKVGDALPSGTLETLAPDSWAEVVFPDGTNVSLSGQTSVAISLIEGRKVLRLRDGDLSIDAAKQPIGSPMQIITPSAQADVLGTRFNVTADEFSARFVVNEGLVRVTRLADGKVEDVAAEEVVVAALEQGTEFTASPRRAFVESWKSELPRDRLQGQWEPGSEDVPDGLRAMPHLWRGESGDPREPILLFSAVFDPSAGRLPPVQLAAGTRFLVRGRINRELRVDVGFGTNRARGGTVGKYTIPHGVHVRPNGNGRFEFTLALEDFKPMRSHFPDSPTGHEIDWLWIQTAKVDAGLVIEGIELSE
ncbi:MAG: FecR family protein [Verrucomicrobiales bacterium]|jgi:ferric-dicitrate binding protein FerR (iron transport regulator)|nr:FecR family protein [Verrucomicrobiales bacterium]